MPSESARWRCSRVALRKAAISAEKDGDGGALWLISPRRRQLRERHLVLRVRETCRYKALFRASTSDAVRVGAVAMFACRSPKSSHFGGERRGWGCAVAEISAARAARRETLSSSCSRDTPLQSRAQSRCQRSCPSRRGDDVRVSLSEKAGFSAEKDGVGWGCAVADISAARAATRTTLSLPSSRDMPLRGPVQSGCQRCRPSRRGDDLRVSLSEKTAYSYP